MYAWWPTVCSSPFERSSQDLLRWHLHSVHSEHSIGFLSEGSGCSCTGKDHPSYLCVLYQVLVCAMHMKGQPSSYSYLLFLLCACFKKPPTPKNGTYTENFPNVKSIREWPPGKWDKYCFLAKSEFFSASILCQFSVHQFCANIELNPRLKILGGAKGKGSGGNEQVGAR